MRSNVLNKKMVSIAATTSLTFNFSHENELECDTNKFGKRVFTTEMISSLIYVMDEICV